VTHAVRGQDGRVAALPPDAVRDLAHPRRTMDPAHAWIRARIAEIAAELDQGAPAARP
jgi:hypothetical protein